MWDIICAKSSKIRPDTTGRKAGIMTEKEEKDRCQQIQEMILREMDCNNGISDEEIL